MRGADFIEDTEINQGGGGFKIAGLGFVADSGVNVFEEELGLLVLQQHTHLVVGGFRVYGVGAELWVSALSTRSRHPHAAGAIRLPGEGEVKREL